MEFEKLNQYEENMSLTIIEDDPIQLKMMEKIFSKYMPKNIIRSFTSSMKGLSFIQKKKPDIIILDIFMQNLDGLELLDNINIMFKNNTEEKPHLIICTTAEYREYRAKAFEKGFMDYIIKPYTPEELVLRTSRVIKFRSMEEKILFLEQAALRDGLTGLWNKRAIEEEFERMSHLSRRYHIQYAIMMIDMDKFKMYNDTYGHLEGDKVLKTVSAIIHKNMRKSDFAGRFGGEEFLLILPYTDKAGAITLGSRILDQLKNEKILHKKNPPDNVATFTAGIAIQESDEDVITVIKKADEALYYGKKYNKKIADFSKLIEEEKEEEEEEED